MEVSIDAVKKYINNENINTRYKTFNQSFLQQGTNSNSSNIKYSPVVKQIIHAIKMYIILNLV